MRQTDLPRNAGCRQGKPVRFECAWQRGALAGSPRRLPLRSKVLEGGFSRGMGLIPGFSARNFE